MSIESANTNPSPDTLGQVEDQRFGVLVADELQRRLVADSGSVALAEALAAERERAAGDLDPGVAAGRETMRDLDAGRQPCRIGARILVDRHRAVGAVGRRHEPQPPARVLVGERLLLVAGRDAARA